MGESQGHMNQKVCSQTLNCYKRSIFSLAPFVVKAVLVVNQILSDYNDRLESLHTSDRFLVKKF
jgi:hypothetical protein